MTSIPPIPPIPPKWRVSSYSDVLETVIRGAIKVGNTTQTNISGVIKFDGNYFYGGGYPFQLAFSRFLYDADFTTGILTKTLKGGYSSITDNHAQWDAAYSHVYSSGVSHTYINQAVTNASSPIFVGLYISDKIYHYGDTNTYIYFQTDEINLFAGGANGFSIDYTSNKVSVSNGVMDIQMNSANGFNIGGVDGSYYGYIGFGTNTPGTYDPDGFYVGTGNNYNRFMVFEQGTSGDWDVGIGFRQYGSMNGADFWYDKSADILYMDAKGTATEIIIRVNTYTSSINALQFHIDGEIEMLNDTWYQATDNAGTGVVNMLKVNTDDEIETGASLLVGNYEFEEDSGAVTFVDMPVSSTPSAGDEESYTFKIDGTNIATIYAEADGSGGIQNEAFKINGGIGHKVTEVDAATYTIDPSDFMIAVDYTATGAVTLTLPSAADCFANGVGLLFCIKDSGANANTYNITINRAGSDTIVTTATGQTSATISADGGVLWIQAKDATTWLAY